MTSCPARTTDVVHNEPSTPVARRPVGVPLSPGCFQASRHERERFVTLVARRVDAMLRDERRYEERRRRDEPFLHAGEWKQVKKEKDLTFYRRNPRGRSLRELALEEDVPEMRRAVERGYTSLLCDGSVPGSIASMLYGMTASSQDELETNFAYKDPPLDCVWLGTVERADAIDPFHTLDLIWALPKLPPMFDQVDVCYLKATGHQVDPHGHAYGYLVLHGVHIPQCPPFVAHHISRASMFFTCLFREPRPGVLKVTVRGIFDLSKKVKMLKRLVSAATTSFMVGLLNGVGIGEAKKLTLLAMRQRHTLLTTVRPSACYLCSRRTSLLGRTRLFRMHLIRCFVCRQTVCLYCTRGVKQRIFLGLKQPCSKVDCCFNCVREARVTIHVRPNEPEYQVVAEYYRKQHASPHVIDTWDVPHSDDQLKTNSTTGGLPTIATSDDRIRDYYLEFDDDPFSIALTSPKQCLNAEEETQDEKKVEKETDSSITIWPGAECDGIEEDDFIPSVASDRVEVDRLSRTSQLVEQVKQNLIELNRKVEQTYAQHSAQQDRDRAPSSDRSGK
ncbi:hypothetical protein PsorP6_006673 [Peronosclerospora sorghi]|uniref:Uncharacterized protein n=1 Tax=Peronosclerospora sorghi TaxID=230839 RepID=A0ACC0W3U2_9STRA|nr:hypothetical protein PsorP6_006673 [Peronosclerospora sorghi]